MVQKRQMQQQLHTLRSEVRAMEAEAVEEGGEGEEVVDEFSSLTPEEEKKREAEAKLFKETDQCVEAGGLLRGLLQEYREEQAHRRAAIRLMWVSSSCHPLVVLLSSCLSSYCCPSYGTERLIRD